MQLTPMSRSTLFIVMLCMIFPGDVWAAEVDQFNGGEQVIRDSHTSLNLAVNQRIKQAIKQANRRRFSGVPGKGKRRQLPLCSEQRLFNALTFALARPLIGQLETFAQTDSSVSRRIVPFEQSIYRSFTWSQSPSLVLSKRLAAVIRIGDIELGADKLGHFFTEGWSYFDILSQPGSQLDDALLFGEWTEGLYFGALTTGVFSYGDLVANFNGLRFWNSILAKQPDPLTHQMSVPYIRCENKSWKLNRHFDWLAYVDNGWNEAMNCSLYRDETLLSEVQGLCEGQQIHLLEDKYAELAKRLINTKGQKVLPQTLQPEQVLQQRYQDIPQWLKQRLQDYRQRLEIWRNQWEDSNA